MNEMTDAQPDADERIEVEGEEDGSAETDLGAHVPMWERGAYRQERERRKQASAALEAERLRTAQLEGRLAALEGRVNNPAPAQPEAKGPSLVQLREWKSDYLTLQHKLLDGSASDDDKTKLLGVKPETLAAVDEKIADLLAEERSGKVKSEINGQLKGLAENAQRQNSLRLEFGNDALDPGSELFKRAAQEFASLARNFSNDDNGAVTWMALDRARSALVNRDGRGGSDADRRRLAVEGQVRRETAPSNAIAALRSKGDWKSKSKAADIEIQQALKQWGYA